MFLLGLATHEATIERVPAPAMWPLYLAFAAYTIVRLLSKDSSVTWPQACAVFALIGLAHPDYRGRLTDAAQSTHLI